MREQDLAGPEARATEARNAASNSQAFSSAEITAVYRAIAQRRDVRRGFLPQPLEEETLMRLLCAAHAGPSVGLMQPWRFIVVRDAGMRTRVHDCFLQANSAAEAAYEGDRKMLYRQLKLEGLLEAPQHLCVVCDRESTQGGGLGRHTMAQTAVYSCVCAVQNLWLAARAEGIGVGWVSIVDPQQLAALLHVPPSAEIIAYLCIGYVDRFATAPDLEQQGWEQRANLLDVVRSEFYEQSYRAAARQGS